MAKLRLDGIIGWDVTAEAVAAQLDGDVQVVLNSPGGSILEGFSIYNALKDHDGKVSVHVDWAGSMASVIAMAGDTITMRDKSSLMMIHRPWSGATGRSEDLRSVADSLDKLEGMLTDIYMDRFNMKRSELSELLDAETYLTAKEAKKYGLIDRVEKSDGGQALVALGGGVQIDARKLAAKVEHEPLRAEIEAAADLKGIEGLLSDSGRLSNAEAVALVSRIRAMARGDRGADDQTSEIAALIRATANTI